MNGYFSLVLHAHLPYVRHPEYEEFLEEDWLYEAITETYIPLLKMFENLKRDNVPFNVTLTVSGTLANMLDDTLLMDRYVKHMNKMIKFCESELERLKDYKDILEVAKHNYEVYTSSLKFFEENNRRILPVFKKFQDMGNLELIPVTATHGFLPMMKDMPQVANAQVKQAKIDYMRHFGKEPKGIWLAECAYYPEQDKYLAESGIRYFLVDAHGLLHANPKPEYGVYAPCYTENGVAAFARDLESSEQVWSSEIGYPGDALYREFHKDAGYELDYDYVKPFLHSDGVRRNTGIKYHAITDKKGTYKALYSPSRAHQRAKEHAKDFVSNREAQIAHLAKNMKYRKPIVVSPYDAELYGHWWYEGPIFLEYVFRFMHNSSISSITPAKYLDKYPLNQVVNVSMSSWGANGYYDVWVDSSNDYVYRHLHKAAQKMMELAKWEPNSDLERRALNQMARELLIAQTSCWEFIMFTGTMVGYAKKKISDHTNRLFKLYETLKNHEIDEAWLSEIESRDNIFPEIDYRIYRG
ncbi:glycoside hydrolase family 57 protein [Oceanivirga miroungae]|uniref:1,4-alpha-glucan branching enzyme n=1 Tax=Oceanivirga miroungae TaxID=1130046 RepID=A0A6I8MC57_9FUSO|nr:1,4-alpha-glucan branching protein domain-containing protein [Oceanivirga miroungae]VWL85805.1 1,4-alpha-glucan branching enzyme [Oceanivirga miroungae]